MGWSAREALLERLVYSLHYGNPRFTGTGSAPTRECPNRTVVLHSLWWPGRDDMEPDKRRELIVFIFLALVLAPILAVLVVSAYGFAVWMFQLIAGPPSV